ncbi:uncharacterized protein LOC126893593 isoform X1 [Daktulosphaira vitifoliae]|uniref:uncharacterized protein LOC126893593 isoform X1 n=1 Tax=Daktulosphaira vitifoliae TaxID=58002 RepID=UPI0021AA61B6|nr:uncharacterized protein LOC126893593 isoform X1 [Daktulosphaira vitifoliae]
MILNQHCVLIIFFGIFCNVQFMTCSWFKWTSTQKPKPDTEELKVAFNLDTGFSYGNSLEMLDMELSELKDRIIKDGKLGINVSTRPQVIYNDLYCSDLFNLLQYTRIIQSLIEHNSTYNTDKFDYLLLNESTIQHMLAVVIKLDLTEHLHSFWNLYMFAIYIKNLRMVDNFLVISHVIDVLDCIIDCLSCYTNNFCRKNNKYNSFDKLNELDFKLEKEKMLMIEKVKAVMVSRNIINKILLHGEEVEIWVSLKKIYLYEILQNTDILKTIIMDFGEQSQKSYYDIIKDINVAYKDARNYYWFDVWITKIKIYHEKIFNIFRVVTLHLIRKHVMYLINKKEKIVKKYNKLMWNFFDSNFYTFYFMIFSDNTDFESISTLFQNTPSNSNESFDNLISNIISNIENKMQTCFVVKSFKILQIKVDDEMYNSNSINNTKILRSYVQISKKKHEEIENLKKTSDNQGLNDNFERFHIFLEYFMKIFINKHKFMVFRSFMKFSSDYEIMKDRRPQDLKEERYLDL